MINYIVHFGIPLKAGQVLNRIIRLSLHPEVGSEWIEIPYHWVSGTPVINIAGVSDAYAASLATDGIKTIGQLAGTEPQNMTNDLPFGKRVELWAKARLTLQMLAHLSPVSGLLDRNAWEVIITPTATLAADAGAPIEYVARLREQVIAIKSALQFVFLRDTTIGELAQPWRTVPVI